MESAEGKIEREPSIELVRANVENVEDINVYISLEKSLENSRTYSVMTTPEEVLNELKKCTVYFIKEGAEVVGSVSYEMKGPDHAYIDGLLVTPPHQNRDIGKAAMVKVLKELKDVPLIDLVTHPDNERAVRLYESLGFSIGERIENYFGDGEPRIVMTLVR